METRSKPKKKHMGRTVLAIILVLAGIAATILLTTGMGGKAAFVTDDKAADGSALAQGEDIAGSLQKAADESMFSFRINSNMVFENGGAEGSMIIESPAHNTYNMQVRIYLDDSGETVYETGVIEPGQGIVRDKLDVILSKGEYAATAIITAIDPETGGEAGKNAAALTITVEG